ncbi:protein tumorous imaginal discs, mitochondrial-like isoform X2 [Stegodyphus dumicola]|uniref:protein tumorous imaginal discs, mitochondrial-like isoform X2 n=1 Tax=Stegodyphus dumicola TaxID=202533 RepID=UPI0015B21A19|nr:protein tumorous imaginal discs, mitochondrial-like isoform X2 [Stegodyphus dumicola]
MQADVLLHFWLVLIYLAKEKHPDVNAGDPEAQVKFQEVSEAYKVLGNEAKQKEYDQWGTTDEFARHGFTSDLDPEELFRNMFQGFHAGFSQSDYAESETGFSSYEVMMNLTFKEATLGVNKDVSLNISDTCPDCNGQRSKPGTKPEKCTFCQGTGKESVSLGPYTMRSTCRKCNGTKVLIKDPCTVCNGQGTTIQKKKVTIPVPSGVKDGQMVRVQITKKKELFVTFKVSKSRYFRRDGVDVHSDATISVYQALLGGTVRIRGLYEELVLKIAPCTSSHARIKLKGKGIRRVNSYGCGDHYVNIKIKAPSQLSAKQRAVVETFLAENENSTPGTTEM